MELTRRSTRRTLITLTLAAAGHILGGRLAHFRPVEPFLEAVESSRRTQMSRCWIVMHSAQDGDTETLRDHQKISWACSRIVLFVKNPITNTETSGWC